MRKINAKGLERIIGYLLGPYVLLLLVTAGFGAVRDPSPSIRSATTICLATAVSLSTIIVVMVVALFFLVRFETGRWPLPRRPKDQSSQSQG